MSHPKLFLTRDRHTEWATLGRLAIDGETICHTLERPWLGNKRGVSCIPTGCYIGAIQPSPRFRANLPELLDVPGRSEILIHAGNTADDTEGCILVGMERHDHEDHIMQSRAALALVLKRLDGCDGFTLTVEDA